MYTIYLYINYISSQSLATWGPLSRGHGQLQGHLAARPVGGHEGNHDVHGPWRYPLVNIPKTMEKSRDFHGEISILNGTIHSFSPFSIAFCSCLPEAPGWKRTSLLGFMAKHDAPLMRRSSEDVVDVPSQVRCIYPGYGCRMDVE